MTRTLTHEPCPACGNKLSFEVTADGVVLRCARGRCASEAADDGFTFTLAEFVKGLEEAIEEENNL